MIQGPVVVRDVCVLHFKYGGLNGSFAKDFEIPFPFS